MFLKQMPSSLILLPKVGSYNNQDRLTHIRKLQNYISKIAGNKFGELVWALPKNIYVQREDI